MLTEPLKPPLTEKELDLLDRTKTNEREKLLIGEIRRLKEQNKEIAQYLSSLGAAVQRLLTSPTG